MNAVFAYLYVTMDLFFYKMSDCFHRLASHTHTKQSFHNCSNGGEMNINISSVSDMIYDAFEIEVKYQPARVFSTNGKTISAEQKWQAILSVVL